MEGIAQISDRNRLSVFEGIGKLFTQLENPHKYLAVGSNALGHKCNH